MSHIMIENFGDPINLVDHFNLEPGKLYHIQVDSGVLHLEEQQEMPSSTVPGFRITKDSEMMLDVSDLPIWAWSRDHAVHVVVSEAQTRHLFGRGKQYYPAEGQDLAEQAGEDANPEAGAEEPVAAEEQPPAEEPKKGRK